MKVKLVSLIICFALFSCQSITKLKFSPAKMSPEKIIETKQDQIFTNSNFDMFYSKFISDSVFQKQHIKFPLIDAINECDSLITLNSESWKFDSDDIRKFDDSMDSLIIKQKEAEFHLILIRKEIGTLYEYKFNKIDGVWYLVYYLVNAC